MIDDRELSALLRDGLAAEAHSVTAGAELADRIVNLATNDAEQPARMRPRRGQAWLLPALAAIVVGILAGSVVLGGKLLHSDPHQPSSQISLLPTPTVSSSPAPAPTPSSSASPSQPSTASRSTSAPSTGSSVPTPAGPVGGPVPAHFRAVDLTWISPDQGWALGTAPCSHAPCTSMVRTRDGGRTWVGVPAPTAELANAQGCVSACVANVRFADNLLGYAFGPDVFYSTVDGGQTWSRQPGGADALEIADGVVLRVTTSPPECLPQCAYRLQRSLVGSSGWQDVALPAVGQGTGVQLVRSGPVVALLTLGNPAGSASTETSVLFTSADDGANWTSRGDPCPRGTAAGGKPAIENDTRAVTVAADRSVTVLCAARNANQPQFTMTSTDAGARFTAAPATLPGTGGLLAAASAKVLLVESGELFRSTDGGRTWRAAVDTPTAGAGPTLARFIGFESSTVGRVLAFGSTDQVNLATTLPRMWTTSDAGATWDAHTFG